ncbi:MAG TPA: hypothetical protein VGK88_00090 [bacterium]|jgi:hypothetical protein
MKVFSYGFMVIIALAIVLATLPDGSSAQAPRLAWQIQQAASARAEDNSSVTLTGKGEFIPGRRDEVAGGGTWMTRGPNGDTLDTGTYSVVELLSWEEAPSTASSDLRAGLATFRIRYSNAKDGILVVSCHLAGTPNSVFEGVTASMGYVQFWNKVPSGTLFTVPGN